MQHKAHGADCVKCLEQSLAHNIQLLAFVNTRRHSGNQHPLLLYHCTLLVLYLLCRSFLHQLIFGCLSFSHPVFLRILPSNHFFFHTFSLGNAILTHSFKPPPVCRGLPKPICLFTLFCCGLRISPGLLSSRSTADLKPRSLCACSASFPLFPFLGKWCHYLPCCPSQSSTQESPRLFPLSHSTFNVIPSSLLKSFNLSLYH